VRPAPACDVGLDSAELLEDPADFQVEAEPATSLRPLRGRCKGTVKNTSDRALDVSVACLAEVRASFSCPESVTGTHRWESAALQAGQAAEYDVAYGPVPSVLDRLVRLGAASPPVTADAGPKPDDPSVDITGLQINVNGNATLFFDVALDRAMRRWIVALDRIRQLGFRIHTQEDPVDPNTYDNFSCSHTSLESHDRWDVPAGFSSASPADQRKLVKQLRAQLVPFGSAPTELYLYDGVRWGWSVNESGEVQRRQ
jgi:hypothetical protein